MVNNETLGEKVDRNDVMYCLEQILETAPYKTAIVWSLTSHLTNYPSKTSKRYLGLPEK